MIGRQKKESRPRSAPPPVTNRLESQAESAQLPVGEVLGDPDNEPDAEHEEDVFYRWVAEKAGNSDEYFPTLSRKFQVASRASDLMLAKKWDYIILRDSKQKVRGTAVNTVKDKLEAEMEEMKAAQLREMLAAPLPEGEEAEA